MNNTIKSELGKVKTKLPDYDDDTTHLIIPRHLAEATVKKTIVDLTIGKYYIIKLERYILYPPENFTLDANWNNGIHPKSEYMLATPIKFVGKMVQFDGCGYDNSERKALDDVYNGLWLPSKGFTIVREE